MTPAAARGEGQPRRTIPAQLDLIGQGDANTNDHRWAKLRGALRWQRYAISAWLFNGNIMQGPRNSAG